jgi:hypothetical protein
VNLLAFVHNPRLAFAVAAFAGCVWLNQGPSMGRYEELTAKASSHVLLRVWLPFAFAYRRSSDEELYFATANAVRGVPYDEHIVLSKRGTTSPAFEHFPPPDGHWHWPYSEVPLEYPALVLPFVLLPAVLASTFAAFALSFGVLMGALMLLSVALAVHVDPRARSPEARARGWWLAAALFLSQGGLLVQRVDAAAAVFLGLALWAAIGRKPLLLGLGVALAAGVKIVPILVLLPLMAADRATFASRRSIARVAAGVAFGLAVTFLPMIALSPSAFASFIEYHRARGLHIESSYGAIVSLVELASGNPQGSTLSFGSYNVRGATADALAVASTPLLVGSVLVLTVWLARLGAPESEPEREIARRSRIASAGLAALALVWLLGKVFSPQYMTWAIPFAVVASDRRIAALLMAAMAVSQIYLRGFYDYVVAMRPLGVVALEVRLVVLVVMTFLVLRAAKCYHVMR